MNSRGDALPQELQGRDCAEGCDGDHVHMWEIEPHPSSHVADVMVLDDDKEALQWLLTIAEQVWDEMEPGEERVIKIRRNKVPE